MHLMLDNCLLFNKPGSYHNRYAQKLLKWWQPKAETMTLRTLQHHGYCCGKRRQLSGISYRCRGGTCFIRYGCVYWHYSPGDNEDDIIFCQSHYQRLGHEVTMPRFGNGTGDEITFKKSMLKRGKHNTPLVPENILSCAVCGHEDHEICKLHLSQAKAPYYCSLCVAREARSPQGVKLPGPHQSPRDLPTCNLSDQLQYEVASRVPLVGKQVCVRVINFERDIAEIKPMLKQRYPDLCGTEKGYPYTRKIILGFIDIEGRPVCFFGLVVHEYGSDCPEPNKERAYISLLDSVKLPKNMLPSAYRTAIYHAITRGYLRYCGERGFRFAHIYTCPPRKGQNYIFPFKPDDQKEINVCCLLHFFTFGGLYDCFGRCQSYLFITHAPFP